MELLARLKSGIPLLGVNKQDIGTPKTPKTPETTEKLP